MKKSTCIIFQSILLIWFLLDMTGLSFGDKCLVEQSFKDDGIFFAIYLVTFVWFILKDSVGKWDVLIWSGLWFITQFLCHEWYTLFDRGCMGSTEGKIKIFSENIQLFSIEGRYVPDLYHIILHVLILCVFITTLIYIIKGKKMKKK